MYEFARFLFPSLTTESEPPQRMLDGLYEWPGQARGSLLAARSEQLFRELLLMSRDLYEKLGDLDLAKRSEEYLAKM